jgi:protein phosphatase 2C-like protein
MTHGTDTGFWTVLGRSVCGASHRRRGAGNQDAIAWSEAGQSAVAAAVADGHGSAASFRSAAGAALAVQAAVSVLRDFAEEHSAYDSAAAAELPARLVAHWRLLVNRDLVLSPFSDAEAAATNGRRDAHWRAYGSTLLAALATPTHILYLQLGDGDILIVSENGAVSRPWPRDSRLLGVETTSLCGSDAVEEMRLAIEPHAGDSPAMVLLATDGYANSFREEDGFLRTGKDLLELVRENGVGGVEGNLEGWLNEASELGSGDDITLAVLCRREAGGGHGR